jgi:hypothetical protein
LAENWSMMRPATSWHDAAAELRGLAGDGELADDVAAGASGDPATRLAVTRPLAVPVPLVSFAVPSMTAVGGVVATHEPRRSAVGHRHGAELDLDVALEVLAVALGERGTGHARREELHVLERLPRGVDVGRDDERVLQLHEHSWAGADDHGACDWGHAVG